MTVLFDFDVPVLTTLRFYGIAEACTTLIDILGMEPLGGTESPTSTSVHALNLSGIVCGGAGKVLARARMTYAPGQGVTLELAARAEQEIAAQLVLSAIA